MESFLNYVIKNGEYGNQKEKDFKKVRIYE